MPSKDVRCRELESDPDGWLDLWARYHYKSTFGTFGGIFQQVLRDPDITVGILSATKALADPFLVQIQQELENNETLRETYADVLWQNPKREANRWSRQTGIVVKRKGNPKEGTVEAHGLIDGQPTGRSNARLLKLSCGLCLHGDYPITPELLGPIQILIGGLDLAFRYRHSHGIGPTRITRH